MAAELLQELALSILPTITPIFIGCSGGVVGVILKHRKPSLRAMLAAAVVSGFAGYITHKLCLSTNLDEHLTNALTGLGGFFGPATLQGLGNTVFKKLGIDISPYIHEHDTSEHDGDG